MKSVAVIALAFACIIGMAVAQFGFGGGFPTQQADSGFGSGGILMLLGVLFLVTFLFNGNNKLGTGATTLIYGNFSSPTGK